MRPDGAGPQLQLPVLSPWMRNLLIGLFALFAVELVLRNLGMPVDALAWRPFGEGFSLWQPLTRYLVQGGHAGAVYNVLFGLLILYFVLPAVDSLLTRERTIRAVIAGAIGGTALPLILDALFLDGSATQGWTVLTTALFVLFGLSLPSGVIRLWFIIPITGQVIVWGIFGLELIFFLLNPSLRTAEGLGTWLGVYAWWHSLGPGGHRRNLRRQARKVEKELRRFQVIEGGKQDDQDRDDDWVH